MAPPAVHVLAVAPPAVPVLAVAVAMATPAVPVLAVAVAVAPVLPMLSLPLWKLMAPTPMPTMRRRRQRLCGSRWTRVALEADDVDVAKKNIEPLTIART